MSEGMSQKIIQPEIPLKQQRSILEVLQAAPDMDRLPIYRNNDTQRIFDFEDDVELST
jgi:hypothetical protein